MRRRFQGLHQADQSATSDIPDRTYLVSVHRAQYLWHAQKPYDLFCFSVLEPEQFAGKTVTGRVYCTAKVLWKLNWFPRDIGYDTEFLGRDEVDDKNLVGLRGVVKISHTVMNGTTLLNLDGFALAIQWGELSVVSPATASGPEDVG